MTVLDLLMRSNEEMFSAQTADSLFVIRELYPSFRSFACIVAIPRGKAADAELMCGVQVTLLELELTGTTELCLSLENRGRERGGEVAEVK